MDLIQDCAAMFEESQRKHSTFPTNIVRMQAFAHAAERYRLSLHQKQLFHETERSLFLLDLIPEDERSQGLKFQNFKLDTIDKIITHISKPKIPTWRFVFLQAASSRSPLSCAREHLTALLTYHQVMPPIADMITLFKPRSRPITHTIFRHESYLEPDSPQFPLPELGRSGIQFQTAFSLLSVEQSSAPGEKNPWPLRQTALYHSFDVVTGQTLFIVLKADTNILRNMAKEAKYNREIRSDSLTAPEKSFTATLLIQLIAIEWCEESWSDYIDYFEHKVRGKSTEGKMAPISAATSPVAIEHNISRRSTQNSPVVSRMNTWARSNTPLTRGDTGLAPSQPLALNTAIPESDGFEMPTQPTSPTTTVPPPMRRTSSLRRSVADLFGRGTSSYSKSSNGDLEMGVRENPGGNLLDLDAGESLSFDHFQIMNQWSEELEQSITAIEQNCGILKQLQEQYYNIVESHGFKENIRRDDISSKLKMFMQRIEGVLRELHIHRGRLQAISRILENDKALYGAALQYSSAKVSEHFAYTARESADKMEDWTKEMHSIAIKTEHETVSMHVITIFTLIFLPGTFIATFFSSGAIQWNEDGTLGSDYIARPGGLRLFFATIIPLTVVIMLVWAVVYWFARRRRNSRQDGGLPVKEP